MSLLLACLIHSTTRGDVMCDFIGAPILLMVRGYVEEL